MPSSLRVVHLASDRVHLWDRGIPVFRYVPCWLDDQIEMQQSLLACYRSQQAPFAPASSLSLMHVLGARACQRRKTKGLLNQSWLQTQHELCISGIQHSSAACTGATGRKGRSC